VPHVTSDHFKAALQAMPVALAETPQIINTTIEGAEGWSRMSELSVE
jgi:quinol monooxygenase YgiN